MTDQPRGAYTPQQDVPLQFDPRSPASRRPMPMALIASGTLLVVLIAAVAMYYSRGVRGDNEPPRPVGEPVAVLKSAPTAAAQPTDPADGLDVSAPQNVPGKAPVFSAAEMGKPETVAVAPAKSTTSRTVATVTPAPETPAPPIAQPAAAKPVVAKTVPVQTAKTVAPKAAAPVKAETAAAASGVRVQIGAFSSAALADKGYSDVAALLSGSMSGKAKHVEPVDKDGTTLYRTTVTGFGDRASATAFCEALKAKGKICFVKS
jgi:cell division protein FtsN